MKKLFNEEKKFLDIYSKKAKEVMALESTMQGLSDEQLKAKTQEFKERIEKGATKDEISVEAFAVLREAAYRSIGLKLFEVQIIGGFALLDFNIAEMKTGEGKTLTAAQPAYVLALFNKGIHIVTVNEYLAERDAENIGRIFKFLGLTVGLNLNEMSFEAKKEAYDADITYTTNSELGFDYLRDNMVVNKNMRVQRPLAYAIIDEVDSILIDESRTPLIISGSEIEVNNLYRQADNVAKALKENEHYEVHLKEKQVTLTDKGIDFVENALNLNNLYNVKNSPVAHAINNALKANYAMHKDVDYVVSHDEVKIVDQFTGRILEGRAYTDGLHQAIEAKENVTLKKETITQATITYQNFFRLYEGLAGMTGTAKTEEEEFQKTYKMDVISIPTNEPVRRIDKNDVVFKNKEAKYKYMLDLIKERHELNQPILIGTVAVETSEEISKILKKAGLKHQVLNAKQNEREAEIIAEAGQPGTITIATNMAGRGTDIQLAPSVKDMPKFMSKITNQEEDPSGLLIVGTERHESRRIDNQLRGRSGRQGDKGESIFFVSFDDDLLRRYIPVTKNKIINALPDDEPISDKLVSKLIENAQKQVESVNYDVRKNVLKYDDVIREQREIIYNQRNYVMDTEDIIPDCEKLIDNYCDSLVDSYLANDDVETLKEVVYENISNKDIFYDGDDVKANVKKLAHAEFDKKLEEYDYDVVNNFCKMVLLRCFDRGWIKHIDEMQKLRESIFLRSYGQVDPLLEYQKEGRITYEAMINDVEANIVHELCKGRILVINERETLMEKLEEIVEERKENTDFDNVGRNDECPCGSGKKFKNCHGA